MQPKNGLRAQHFRWEIFRENTMTKPKKITMPVWNQHKNWMNIMKEGSSTGVSVKRNSDTLSKK